MPVKRVGKDGFIVTGNEINTFRSIAIKHALNLDVNHGLKRRGRSILQIAREDSGIHFRTKKEALKWYEETYPTNRKEP